MEKSKFTYKEKINAISSYFGISEDASRYIYHRRRRGFPFKRNDDPNFLKWDMQLQNAFIKADQIATLNWNDLKFDDDLKVLLEHGIDIDTQPKTPVINKINQTTSTISNKSNKMNDKDIKEEDDDNFGWTVVTNKKGHIVKKYMLRKMGLLPHTKPTSYQKNKSYKKNNLQKNKED